MATLKYIADPDLMTVTLGGAYTAGDGQMTLTAGQGARLPTTGDFWIRPTTATLRIFKVTANAADVLTTVIEAAYGADDTNYPLGTEFKWSETAEALDQLRSDQNREMTVAQFDALAATEYKNGDRIWLSDGLYEVNRIGGAWSYRYGTHGVTRPPSAGWSWDNQASSVIDSTNGYEYLSVPKSGTVTMTARYRTAPAKPYTVKFLLKHDISGAPPGASGTNTNCGFLVGFRDAAGKFVNLRIYTDGSGAGLTTDKWTNSTTFSAGYTNYQATGLNAFSAVDLWSRQDVWLAISNTNTNLLEFYWSIDGLHWKKFDSRSDTDFFASAPTDYGFSAYANGCAVELAVISLKETASNTP